MTPAASTGHKLLTRDGRSSRRYDLKKGQFGERLDISSNVRWIYMSRDGRRIASHASSNRALETRDYPGTGTATEFRPGRAHPHVGSREFSHVTQLDGTDTLRGITRGGAIVDYDMVTGESHFHRTGIVGGHANMISDYQGKTYVRSSKTAFCFDSRTRDLLWVFNRGGAAVPVGGLDWTRSLGKTNVFRPPSYEPIASGRSAIGRFTQWVVDPRNRYVAHGQDRSVELWSVKDARVVWHERIRRTISDKMAFSGDGSILVEATKKELPIRETESGNIVREFPTREFGHTLLVVNRDGTRAWTLTDPQRSSSSGKGKLREWNLESGEIEFEVDFRSSGYTFQLHPDGRYLVFYGIFEGVDDLCVFDTKSRKVVWRYGGREGLGHVFWSGDGKRLRYFTDALYELEWVPPAK